MKRIQNWNNLIYFLFSGYGWGKVEEVRYYTVNITTGIFCACMKFQNKQPDTYSLCRNFLFWQTFCHIEASLNILAAHAFYLPLSLFILTFLLITLTKQRNMLWRLSFSKLMVFKCIHDHCIETHLLLWSIY